MEIGFAPQNPLGLNCPYTETQAPMATPAFPDPQAPPRTLQPRPTPAPVTPALIVLNVLVFLGMAATGVSLTEPTALQLVHWGANYGPLTVSGQGWRLLTACFLHIGFIHIAFNMYVLYQVGPFTERLFGPWRYLFVYLAAGIGGNVLGLVLHPNIVSAGASGAIFGVYGGLLAFLLRQRAIMRPDAAKSVAKSAIFFLGYNLVYGIVSPHTDLTAHLGGLVVGFVVGYALASPTQLLRSLATSA